MPKNDQELQSKAAVLSEIFRDSSASIYGHDAESRTAFIKHISQNMKDLVEGIGETTLQLGFVNGELYLPTYEVVTHGAYPKPTLRKGHSAMPNQGPLPLNYAVMCQAVTVDLNTELFVGNRGNSPNPDTLVNMYAMGDILLSASQGGRLHTTG